MTEISESTPSVINRTRSVAAGAPVVGLHFLKTAAAFVLGEEAVLLVTPDGEQQRIDLHGGAILSSDADQSRIITGGDDGKVAALTAAGTLETIAMDPKRRWIDHVAAGP